MSGKYTPPRNLIRTLSSLAVVADGATDQASKIQWFLDQSAGKPVTLINDLAGNLVVSSVLLWPNTTVQTLEGGVWQMAVGSAGPLIGNKHPLGSWPVGTVKLDGSSVALNNTLYPGGTSGWPTPPDDTHSPATTSNGDYNIVIQGGRWDGNRRGYVAANSQFNGRTTATTNGNNAGQLINTFGFFGVKGMVVEDVHVYDPVSLAMQFGNFIDLTLDDVTTECPSLIYGSNTDGPHFNGPWLDLKLRNLKIIRSGDDALNFAADDSNRPYSAQSTSVKNQFGNPTSYIGWGSATTTRGENVNLVRCSSGVRLLSGSGDSNAASVIEDFRIDGVHGTCLGEPLYGDDFLFTAGSPSLGRISFSEVSVQSIGFAGSAPALNCYDSAAYGFTAPTTGTTPAISFTGVTIGSLELSDLECLSTDTTPFLSISGSTVPLVSINGLNFNDTNSATAGIDLIKVSASANVSELLLLGCNWVSSHSQNGVGVLQTGATLSSLVVSGSSKPSAATWASGTIGAKSGDANP